MKLCELTPEFLRKHTEESHDLHAIFGTLPDERCGIVFSDRIADGTQVELLAGFFGIVDNALSPWYGSEIWYSYHEAMKLTEEK